MQSVVFYPFCGGLIDHITREVSLLIKVPIDRGIRFQGILDEMLANKVELFAFSRTDQEVCFRLFTIDFPKKIDEFSAVFQGLIPYAGRYKREITPHLMWIRALRTLRGEGVSALAGHILARDELIKEHPGLLLDVLKGVVDTTIARRDEVLSLGPGEETEKGEMHFFSVSLPEIILLLSEAEEMFSKYRKRYENKILRYVKREARRRSKLKKRSAATAALPELPLRDSKHPRDKPTDGA